jgi:hypothetical protein
MVTSATGVCTITTGAAPSRTFVVTWQNATLFGMTGTSLTFSLMLHEGTNVIDVVYNTLTGSNTHGGITTIGVQNETGGVATQFEYDTANTLPATLPTTIRFTPM